MHEYAAHDDPTVTPTHDGPGAVTDSTLASRSRGSAGACRLFTVLVLTAVGLTGAVSTAAASVGQPVALGSPATVTRPQLGDDARKGGDRNGDEFPCDGKVTTGAGHEALICPDWSPTGRIPVFEKPDKDSEPVGYINAAGDDFYFCQKKGGDHRLGEFVNNWWAFTEADGEPGRGWVPETYFKGGGPNEKDAVLKACP